jgi:hypothetical protein
MDLKRGYGSCKCDLGPSLSWHPLHLPLTLLSVSVYLSLSLSPLTHSLFLNLTMCVWPIEAKVSLWKFQVYN